MKKIKLTEKDLTKIISKVIKEQEFDDSIIKCEGGDAWKNDGYQLTAISTSKVVYKKNISPGTSFYIKHKPSTTAKYCSYTLYWEDAMTPINLGGPGLCFGVAKAYEDAFKMKRARTS